MSAPILSPEKRLPVTVSSGSLGAATPMPEGA